MERELQARRAVAREDAIVRAAHDPAEDLNLALGQRPESPLDGDRWDTAARAYETYRQRYGQLPETSEPRNDIERQRTWRATRDATDELGRDDLGRDDLGSDTGPGDLRDPADDLGLDS